MPYLQPDRFVVSDDPSEKVYANTFSTVEGVGERYRLAVSPH